MLDKDIAIETFVERCKVHSKEPKIDNGSLYAGSPMYFYCKGCTRHIATLPENYIVSPPRYCEPCQVLVNHGLLDVALKKYEKEER